MSAYTPSNVKFLNNHNKLFVFLVKCVIAQRVESFKENGSYFNYESFNMMMSLKEGMYFI